MMLFVLGRTTLGRAGPAEAALEAEAMAGPVSTADAPETPDRGQPRPDRVCAACPTSSSSLSIRTRHEGRHGARLDVNPAGQ
jgi:hypothetical protein